MFSGAQGEAKQILAREIYSGLLANNISPRKAPERYL